MCRHELNRELLHLVETGREDLDLTNREHLAEVKDIANWLLDIAIDADTLSDLENQMTQPTIKDHYPLGGHLAAKLAKSRALMLELDQPVHVSVVFAVYKEHHRILQQSEHPHGEDFLIRKMEQLDWLFAGRDDLTWDMIVVDDGCPIEQGGSGGAAQRIINERCHNTDRIRVLYLKDAIRNDIPVTRPLTTTDQSRKGGSIAYGMWDAANRIKHKNHVIIFTDADLSTHLGQVGLLVDDLINNQMDVAIGSRRENASVVVKKGVRNTRGKLFIYLWKRLLPELSDLIDTQCGFKGFRASVVRDIVDGLIEKQFAFDVELLLKAEQRNAGSISKVPVAWIDSEAASTTTDIQPYLSMLKAIAAMYAKYTKRNTVADSFADLINEMTEESWNTLVENIPTGITNREPIEYNEFDGVSAAQLAAQIDC